MLADIISYTCKEGGYLISWPFLPSIKPSNPELLTMKLGYPFILWYPEDSIRVAIHSLILSDGDRWDSINGFNKRKGPH